MGRQARVPIGIKTVTGSSEAGGIGRYLGGAMPLRGLRRWRSIVDPGNWTIG